MVQSARKQQSRQASGPVPTDSEFAMWRAVFAFTFVDNVLSLEEQDLLHSYLTQVPFSSRQLIILKEDLKNPKDVVSLYRKIASPDDKKRFCVLARAIVWCEGSMDEQERAILKRLSCFKEPLEANILSGTRDHPYLDQYYRQYAKSGVMGLFKTPHLVEIRV